MLYGSHKLDCLHLPCYIWGLSFQMPPERLGSVAGGLSRESSSLWTFGSIASWFAGSCGNQEVTSRGLSSALVRHISDPSGSGKQLTFYDPWGPCKTLANKMLEVVQNSVFLINSLPCNSVFSFTNLWTKALDLSAPAALLCPPSYLPLLVQDNNRGLSSRQHLIGSYCSPCSFCSSCGL